MTRSLVALNARYQQHTDAAVEAQLLGDLLSVAAARQQFLADLVESEPGTVLSAAVPAEGHRRTVLAERRSLR